MTPSSPTDERQPGRITGLGLACAIALLFSWNCAPREEGEPAAHIVTTIYPLQLIVAEITGRAEDVACLLPPGATPHTFEPLASDLARINHARLFVRVGGGVDVWAERLLGAMQQQPPLALTVLDIPGLRLIHRDAAGSDDHREHDGHSHGDSDIDPHVWLDPVRVRDEIVPAVVDALAKTNPDKAKDYRLRAARFRTLLSALDEELRTTLAPVKGRAFLAFHDTWRYFADRYGLQQRTAVYEFAGEEPTPHEIADIVTSLRREKVRSVIVEPQFSPRLAEVVSEEIDGVVVEADPLGSPVNPERDSYERLMRYNGASFLEALSAP